jgi:hypothetical protein
LNHLQKANLAIHFLCRTAGACRLFPTPRAEYKDEQRPKLRAFADRCSLSIEKTPPFLPLFGHFQPINRL